MNIEGFSEATAKAFYEAGFLKTPLDIYNLKNFKTEIMELEGFGERSCEKLLENVEASKNAPAPAFLAALGIPQVGPGAAKALCEFCNYNLEEIFNASKEDLLGVVGFGEVIADSVVAFFKENETLIRDFLKTLRLQKPAPGAVSGGLVFVVTGKLNRFKSRDELAEFIESKGWKAAAAVGKKTNYLITNDTDSGSSKNKKAKELGVKIISEEDFIKLFADSDNNG
jgi:DNA ligase (NAD+)